MTWRFGHHIIPAPSGPNRVVSIALPAVMPAKPLVVFCTDGQALPAFSTGLSSARPDLHPVLIGVHSDPQSRAQHYLFDGGVHYQAHEDFFVDVLPVWLHAEYGLSLERSRTVAFGFSNGGAFVLTMGLRHPDSFSAIFSFSSPKLPTRPCVSRHQFPMPAIYLATGCIGPEKKIRQNVLQLARWLRSRDIPVTVSEQQAAHTLDFWAAEFPEALDWFHSHTNAPTEKSQSGNP